MQLFKRQKREHNKTKDRETEDAEQADNFSDEMLFAASSISDEDFVQDAAESEESESEALEVELESEVSEVSETRRSVRMRAERRRVSDSDSSEHSSCRRRRASRRVSRRVDGVDGYAPISTTRRTTQRKIKPTQVAEVGENPPPPPPQVIDKPREERSYKEFFPDLDLDAALDIRLDGDGDGDGDGGGTESPSSRQNTDSGGLSIKLVFSEPGVGRGKSPHAFAGAQSSVVVLAPKKPTVTLPVARFRELSQEEAQLTYKRSEFRRPATHYIRNVEATEGELASRVEYDLEEEDRLWMEGQGSVTAEEFEATVDRIEKEWFDLVKDVQKAISAMQQERLAAEDAACAICGEEECDNTNAIVFCDGCNMAVHQDCYGVPYIPEGQWLCRRCMLSPDKPVFCIFCPQRGGAFKKTTTNKWAHLLCALWIPEVGIANTVYMEPIDSVDLIPRSRWKLYCHLCHRKAGACIQCSHRQCFTAFHVTCARKAHLPMAVRADRRSPDPVFRVYCERHAPADCINAIDLTAPLKALASARRHEPPPLSLLSTDLAALLAAPNGTRHPPTTSIQLLTTHGSENAALLSQASEPERATALGQPVSAQTLRASSAASLTLTMAVFNPDKPILNEYVYSRVVSALRATRLTAHKTKNVACIARYWALRRATRHGAPLLKRLHLEPWTASATQQRALEMAEEQRHTLIHKMRNDLERVRMLVESVRRRERQKLKRSRVQVDYLRQIIDPLTPIILPVIDELITRRDPRGVLSHPVSLDDAPDYLDHVKTPMDFGTIRDNVLSFRYADIDAFEHDLRLVITNCTHYNKPNTYYYQLAFRVLKHIDRLMADARSKWTRLPVDLTSGKLMVDVDYDIFSLNLNDPVPPAILQEQDAESITDQTTDQENKDAAPVSSKPAKSPVETPRTRSRSRNLAVSETPNTLVSETTTVTEINNVHDEKDQETQSTPQNPKTTSHKTESPQRPKSPPKTRSRQKARESRQESKSPQKPNGDDNNDSDSTPQTKRKPTKGWAWVADPIQPKKRRLTMFEQLSVPPPDTRSRTDPASRNVLKNRLRHASTPTPTPRQKKSTHSKRPPVVDPLPSPAHSTANAKPRTAAEQGEDPSKYPIGTVVWAKMASYPWFPAEIFDPKSKKVPDGVHEDKKDAARNTLVYFFDANRANRTWKWLSPQAICKLGVDKDTDIVLYRAKYARSSWMIRSVRSAYLEACKAQNLTPLAIENP